ncbi:MAG: hypothetical protein ACI9MB_001492 [Verrucomicrobiales bacterium]|jgi:hypothetical protein
MKLIKPRSELSKLALLGCVVPTTAGAIVIQIDTTYDTGGFFANGTDKRARLEDATGFFEGILADDLDAITPTGTFAFFGNDSWSAEFTNPSSGNLEFVDDLIVPADTLILYVGARDLPGAEIGKGGFGLFDIVSVVGSSFDQAVRTRGETDVGFTDFAPWGGYLSVDSEITWDTTLAGAGGSDQHLYSTLIHEIGHALGLGTAASWNAQVSSARFTGIESTAEHGGNVLVDFDSSTSTYPHWRDGITISNIYGTSTSQEAAMDPSITPGDVKLFTDLDVAALDDIGWEIRAPVPEPSQALLLATGLAMFLRRRRAC